MAQPRPSPSADESRRPRSDQLRNRRRILNVAREMFARVSAADVQLEDVAEAAGVSRATLFRHIGSKEALIREIYRERADDIAALGDRALACPDAWDGVELAIRTLAQWMHEDRGLWDFARAIAADGSIDAEAEVAIGRLTLVLDRARRAGALCEEVLARDLLPLLAYANEPSPDRLEPLTEIVLRGLRADPPG